MIRFAVLGAAAFAALLFVQPALAGQTDCLTPLPTVAKDVDISALKPRIADCTRMLGGELTPDNRILALNSRAQAYFATGSYLRSLQDVKALSASAPDSPDADFDLGLVYNGLGYPSLALPLIERAIQKGYDTAPALASKAFAETGLGRYQEAIDDANLAIGKDDSVGFAYRARALAEVQVGRMESALPDFDKAIAEAPQDGTLYLFRGIALYGLDRYQDALNDLEQARNVSKGAISNRGYENEIRAILASPPTNDSPATTGDAPVRPMGRTHNCGAYYPYVQVVLGQAGTIILRYDLSATGTISGATVEQSSGNDVLDHAAVVCVNTHWRSVPPVKDGKTFASQQRVQIIFIMPSENISLPLRAEEMTRLGLYDEAIADYSQSLAKDSKSSVIYLRRGFLHYWKANYPAAMSDFDNALALQPDLDDAKAGHELAQAAMANKQSAAAASP